MLYRRSLTFAMNLLLLAAMISSCTSSEQTRNGTNPEITDSRLPEQASSTPLPTVDLLTKIPDLQGLLPDHQQISFAIEDIDNGFKIVPSVAEEQIAVLETSFTQAIDGVTYSVHVIRSSHPFQDGTLTQMDALVVDPDTKQFHCHPMSRVFFKNSQDQYLSSAVQSYGMINDRELLFLSVVNAHETSNRYFTYQLAKLDIMTGHTTIIADDLSEITIDDYSRGWLNKEANTLIINSEVYGGKGLLWSVNVANGDIQLIGEGIKSIWPFIMTSAASDGNRFMNMNNEYKEYMIYNGEGELLSKIPYGENKQVLFSFEWSPSGKHAAITYTSDINEVIMIRNNREYSDMQGSRYTF